MGSGAKTPIRERLEELLIQLATAKLWLGTLILLGLSLALIGISFLQGGPGADSFWVYLELQLGTGLLVGAVGTALLQTFTVRVRRRYEQEMSQLVRQDLRGDLSVIENLLGDLGTTVTQVRKELWRQQGHVDPMLRSYLQDAGIRKVYRSLDEAARDMTESVGDPAVREIRLLGRSLEDLLGSKAALRDIGAIIEQFIRGERRPHDDTGKLAIRMMLSDPYSAGARLLVAGSAGGGRQDQLDRFTHKVLSTAEHFMALEEELVARDDPRVSFELRFHRVPPYVFHCGTDSVTYTFWFPYAKRHDVRMPIAVLSSGEGSRLHHGMGELFDRIWRSASVPAASVVAQHCRGIDKGAAESGLVNVYMDSDSTMERIHWLLKNASRRVWIQGQSLAVFFETRLIDTMEALIQAPEVDVRLLLLDPESEQARSKAFRQHLLLTRKTTSWSSFRDDPESHRETPLHRTIEESIHRILDIRDRLDDKAVKFEARTYACAPSAGLIIVDDRVLIEQYQYGKDPSVSLPRTLPQPFGAEMPMAEYHLPNSSLFPSQSLLNPVRLLQDHYEFVFDHFGESIRRRDR